MRVAAGVSAAAVCITVGGRCHTATAAILARRTVQVCRLAAIIVCDVAWWRGGRRSNPLCHVSSQHCVAQTHATIFRLLRVGRHI